MIKFVKSPLTLLSVLLGCCIWVLSCSDKAEVVDTDNTNSKASWDFGKRAYEHTEKILSFGPRPIESEPHKKTQKYIRSELEKHGWAVMKQSFKAKTPYGERKFTNIIARYNISRNAGEIKMYSPKAILGAHYDSKLLEGFLGADDAASCVGSLIELAEYFHKHDRAKAQFIELVFFDGEEALKRDIIVGTDGLYGSRHYAYQIANIQRYQYKPIFGIILDMIGHKNLSIKIPSDTHPELVAVYANAVKKNKFEKHFSYASGPIIDDHYFLNKTAKVPTIDIIGDFANKEWWHTDNDNIDIISKDSLNMSLKITIDMLNELFSKIK